MDIELPGLLGPVPSEFVVAVLKKYAPDKLMNVHERNSLLRHVQLGNPPDSWYYWYKFQDLAPLQMPELLAAVAAKNTAKDAISQLTPEVEDAEIF